MTDKKPIDKMIELSEDLGLYKEQIIIDGVDVSKCTYFNNTDESYCEECCSEFGCALCDDRPNCYFKQLARKTQECEELKNNLYIANTNHEAAEKECDRYLEALDEIREIIASQDVGTRPKLYDFEQDSKILDIISKAKGGVYE